MLEQARKSCIDASRRLEDAQRGLEQALASERSGLAVDVARRSTELASYRVAAARLAWFHSVVHHERMKARFQLMGTDPDLG
ncbi:MAG: hypothetical protein U1F43_22630 [Myxococcota bacterium]